MFDNKLLKREGFQTRIHLKGLFIGFGQRKSPLQNNAWKEDNIRLRLGYMVVFSKYA
jgi:hypothetical protein